MLLSDITTTHYTELLVSHHHKAARSSCVQNYKRKRGCVTLDPTPASFCRECWTTCLRPACPLLRSAIHYFSFSNESGQGVYSQDGGAVGSRRGDFNSVQYRVFPHGYTRRGKGCDLYFISQHVFPLLVVSVCVFWEQWCVYEVYTAHGKVTRGCNRSITRKTLVRKYLWFHSGYI